MKPVLAEAPGRLDFLGGVADYSGSLVLQIPTHAATRVRISPSRQPRLSVRSVQEESRADLPLETVVAQLRRGRGRTDWRSFLAEQAAPAWTRYPLGSLLLAAECWGWRPSTGLDLLVSSRVPTSMGVSSSAALEVATLRALERFVGRRFAGTELARLAQRAENEIVGAPCGLMDQLASQHGERGALLPILCRPDLLRTPTALPPGVTVVGWPSGVKHAVSGSPYAVARAAAFMGKALAEKATGRRLGHAAELTPSRLRSLPAEVLPARLSGADFLRRGGALGDPLSRVDPRTRYPVRAGLTFPVEENERAALALALLRGATRAKRPEEREEALRLTGELLLQSHAGYGDLGLGSPETDAMVDALRELGPEKGVYGARVSGGGSGGTVVVLLRRSALPRLARLIRSAPAPRLQPLSLVRS